MNRKTPTTTLRVQIEELRIPANRGLHTQQFLSHFRAELERQLRNSGSSHNSRIPSPVKRPSRLSPGSSRSATQLAYETALEVARQVRASENFPTTHNPEAA